MKGPRSSNLVYPTMAVAHEGLASLGVDLHEVGDLLARTNSLVQLHNLVGANLGHTTLQEVTNGVLMMNSLLLCFK